MSAGLTVPVTGYIGTLGGIPINTEAYGSENWAKLYRAAGKKRRTNVLLDGTTGERGYPGDVGATDPFDLFWTVIGSHDIDGEPVADPTKGLEVTLDYLAEHWFTADEDERGTIEAQIITPRGRLFVVRVQVDEFAPSGEWDDCELRLGVRIPAGPLWGVEPDSS